MQTINDDIFHKIIPKKYFRTIFNLQLFFINIKNGLIDIVIFTGTTRSVSLFPCLPLPIAPKETFITKLQSFFFRQRVNWFEADWKCYRKCWIKNGIVKKHGIIKITAFFSFDQLLTLNIHCGCIGGSISKFVTRHTSIFSAVCPAHIRYCQLRFVCWKTDPPALIYWRSIFGPWYSRYWITSGVTR